MRLRITHQSSYRYETPASYAIQTLRLAPRSTGQQYVTDWRIDVNQDCRLSPVEDPFGNLTHSFSVDGPLDELIIVASGEVLTEDTTGIVAGTPERLPLALFLRDTDLTRPSPAIRADAEAVSAAAGSDRLAVLHALMGSLHKALDLSDEPTRTPVSAETCYAAGTGAAEEHAHVFVAAARSLGIPARVVTGYRWREDAPGEQPFGHAWAEAHVGALGWVGFDSTADQCPTEAYVRVAAGLDHLDAAPIRGTRSGGTLDRLAITVSVRKLGDF
jgi:transglutaminase-like putative cysteine protease